MSDTGPLKETLLARLGGGAFAFAYEPQADAVRLIALTDEAIARAAFLDQRVLTPQTQGEWIPLRGFAMAAGAVAAPSPNMIFHMGHCGSTLLSKLIAQASGAAAFREPLPLRTLAAEWADAESGDSHLSRGDLEIRLRTFLQSWGRGPGATVKASSVATNLAAPFLASRAGARAVFMYLQPEPFIAVMLGGDSNRNDLAAFAKFRRRRLAREVPDLPPLHALSPGALAALVWLAEASAAARASGPALMPVDFDVFLSAPAEGLACAAAHLGVAVEGGAVEAAIGGGLMRTYSKAPEHAFSPEARRDYVASYRQEWREEIAKGMALIETCATSAPIAQALSLFVR